MLHFTPVHLETFDNFSRLILCFLEFLKVLLNIVLHKSIKSYMKVLLTINTVFLCSYVPAMGLFDILRYLKKTQNQI